jgi:hypothetical protein
MPKYAMKPSIHASFHYGVYNPGFLLAATNGVCNKFSCILWDPEGPLMSSQKSANGPYSEPD